jgi:hypothetical protein
MDLEEVIGGGDRLVIAQYAATKGRGSGLETAFHHAVSYRFHGGKIIEIKEFRTKGEAVAAVGLSD